MIFDDNHNYFIVKLNLYKLINPISPESGIKNAISAGSGRDIHLKSSQQARSSWLSSTLFGLHVSDPHTVRKTYLYEEVFKKSHFSSPRAQCFYYKWFTIMYTKISYSLEFNGRIFGIVFDSFCSIFRFSMRLISLLHSYLTAYHSQTFAVRKACISAFCGKKQTWIIFPGSYFTTFFVQKAKN